MIVFGYNNFLIRSFSSQDAGLSPEQATGVKLQVRQRYAHIFWIPIFPIGKLWVLKRDGDNKLYEMPLEIKKTIQSRHGKPGTPWYSFSLPLLGLLALLIFYLSELQSEQSSINYFYNNYEETKLLIEYPTTGDCYVFSRYQNLDRYESDKIILKVKSYNEEEIQFISLYENFYKDAEGKDSYDYHNSFDLAELSNFNPTYIKKEDLKNTLQKEHDKYSVRVKLPPLKGYFKLEELDRRELE